VAASLTSDPERVTDLVNASLLIEAALGALGALVLAAMAPLLAQRVLHLGAPLDHEATAAFYWTAAALPMALLAAGLRAVLEAVQRFDLVNLVRAPTSAVTFLAPALGAALGWSLPAIVVLLALGRAAAVAGYLVLVHRGVPGLGWRLPRDWHAMKPLVGFGGWVTVSNVVSPVLVYGDRFLLASLAGAAAAGYYTAPFEAANRLLIIPGSVAAALFPAVSALSNGPDRTDHRPLLGAAVRQVAWLLTVPLLAILVLAPWLLRVWLGAAFAEQAGLALRILSVGVAANSLGQVYYAAVQGVGRPDLTARFHLLELPVYAAGAWLLVVRFGIPGAAAAWSLRMVLDTVLLWAASGRVVTGAH
jgi:O-antigen/teichoic acid export membrane protein